jgi:tetratricopeptide (TPR) repeat protein
MADNKTADNNPAPVWKRLLVTLSPCHLVTLSSAAACLALGIGGYVWLFPSVPAPPLVPEEIRDPAVKEAVASARKKVVAAPRSGAAWGDLGKVLLAHDAWADGAACLLQAERLAPGESRWPYLYGMAKRLQGDPEAALPRFRRAVELAGDDPPVLRLRLADALLEQGRLEEAEVQYRRALRPDEGTSNPWAHLGLARLLAQRGQLTEGLTCVRTAAQSPPTRAAALTLLAEIHQRLGDPAAARDDLALRAAAPADLAPPDPFSDEVNQTRVGLEGDYSRARALLNQERIEEALAQFQGTTQRYPDSEIAWRMLGTIRIRQGDLAGAEQNLETAVRLVPDSFESRFLLGLVQYRRERYVAGAATFRRVLELKPDCVEAHGNLADCLNRQGDRAGAIAVFQTALRYHPYRARLHEELAALLALDGREAEAVEHRQRARELKAGSSGGSNKPQQ